MRILNELDGITSQETLHNDELFLSLLSEMVYGPKTSNKLDFVFAKKLIYLILIDKVRNFNIHLKYISS